jgi:hypothetical protein
VPWFNTLGNHDYGYPTSVDSQIQYRSPNANRWILPARYYYRRITFPGKVNISLVVLDSTPCMSDYRSSNPRGWDPCGSVIPGCPGCTFHQNVIAQSCTAQHQWFQNIVTQIPSGDWKILMAHAPATDVDVMDFIAVQQQAQFDMYLNGHVHLMAHYTIDNSGTYVTTGGGCMVRVPDAEEEAAEIELIKRGTGRKQRAAGAAAAPVKVNKTAAERDAARNGAKVMRELQHGDELMKLRKDKRAGKLGMTSCPSYSRSTHSCQLVFQQTVAGYTTHTFSDDYNELYTYIYNYNGELLHSLSVRKGTGGGSGSGPVPAPPSSSGSSNPVPPPPPPPPQSGSSSSGSSGCCVHDSSARCPAGQVCCSDAGRPYDKENCDKWGWKHDCKWDYTQDKCIVR